MSIAELEEKLQVYGLHLRGLLKPGSDEIEKYQLKAGVRTLIALVGNTGSSYWPVFVRSPEYRDGRANPLDRWSRRIGDRLAAKLGAKVIYPFEGPPYYPFQQWAKRAESLKPSPMGLMIHPKYGLWHSYRFALLIPAIRDVPVQPWFDGQSPCESCVTRPCLKTCPVDAFAADGYDVESCADYLKSTSAARCHSEGCLARSSCPVGLEYRYNNAEHRFHLSAFLA